MRLRILNHDYAGHPFQVQLSRELARRGHEVLHEFSASNQTPHGVLTRQSDDPPTFEVAPIFLKEPFQKWSYWKRRKQEIEYGRLIAQEIARWRPDVVLSGNTPTEAQRVIQQACRAQGSRFVFWVQDFYSVAVHKILKRKLPGLGHAVGWWYMLIERALLRRSDGIIVITEDFQPLVVRWGVDPGKVHVIHNWAPLDEVPLRPRANAWSSRHDLDDKVCLVYSGTLGMKHNPGLLLELARHFQANPRVRVVVVTEGPAADWLRQQRDTHRLSNLVLLGWQPFDLLPDVLATADVLLAILEPDAGVFSVPSKVLTYLCAERALLLAVPQNNLAARIVRDNEAGIVVAPEDDRAFMCGAEALVADEDLRRRLARNARAYALAHFDIGPITDRFEAVFDKALS